jgi:hypothetical protein
MYVKIKNNSVDQYPYYINTLKTEYLNTSFPSNLEVDFDCLAEYGVYRVFPTSSPNHNTETHKVLETTPTLSDNKWTQNWQLVELTPEEVEQKISGFAQLVRDERSRLLVESDWTQAKDIPDALSAKWAPYRQALRDITNQPGFPHEVTWPTKP